MFLVTKDKVSIPEYKIVRGTVLPLPGDNRTLGEETRSSTQPRQRFLLRSSLVAGVRATFDPDMVQGDWHNTLPVGSGTWLDPFTWDKNCNATRTSSFNVVASDPNIRRSQVFFAVQFEAGVTYRMGSHFVSGNYDDMYIYLWEPDAAGALTGDSAGRIAYDDDSNWDINGVRCNAALQYTSPTTRMLIVGPGTYRDGSGSTLTLEIYPPPARVSVTELNNRFV